MDTIDPSAASVAEGWPSGCAGVSLSFVDGTLMLFRDGTGELSFDDRELDWELSAGIDYRTMKLPASEVIAIRDQLNRLYPPEALTPAASTPEVPADLERIALDVADTIEAHMKSSAMIWSLGRDLPDDWMAELRSITVAALEAALTAPEVPAMTSGERPYLADRFEWAAPGDQQQDAWLLRFCDRDMREMIWTGPDAKREAWEAWERYAPAWNCYVFRLAALQSKDAAP